MSRKNQLMSNITTLKSTITERSNPQQSVTLVAVTKTVDTDIIRDLYDLGLSDFGENRPNVLVNKIMELRDLRDQISWHFIGNLQSRQVKNIINDIDYLHSLDRMSLAKEIQKRAEHPIKCFLQLNISGEESKSGFAPQEIQTVIESMAAFDKIEIIGLMTMAPIDASDEEIQRYFAELSSLQQAIAEKNYPHAPCSELSMGMTQDYPIAIEEGASFIRVGTALYDGIEL